MYNRFDLVVVRVDDLELIGIIVRVLPQSHSVNYNILCGKEGILHNVPDVCINDKATSTLHA